MGIASARGSTLPVGRPLTSGMLASAVIGAALCLNSGCGMVGGFVGQQIGGRLINHVLAPAVGEAVGRAIGNQMEKELLRSVPQQPPQPVTTYVSQPVLTPAVAQSPESAPISAASFTVAAVNTQTPAVSNGCGRVVVVRENQSFDTAAGAIRLIEDDENDQCVLEFCGSEYRLGAFTTQSFEQNGKSVTLRVEQIDGPGDSVRLALLN